MYGSGTVDDENGEEMVSMVADQWPRMFKWWTGMNRSREKKSEANGWRWKVLIKRSDGKWWKVTGERRSNSDFCFSSKLWSPSTFPAATVGDKSAYELVVVDNLFLFLVRVAASLHCYYCRRWQTEEINPMIMLSLSLPTTMLRRSCKSCFWCER